MRPLCPCYRSMFDPCYPGSGRRLSGCGRCVRATDPCLILVIQAPEADYLDAAVVSVLQIHVPSLLSRLRKQTICMRPLYPCYRSMFDPCYPGSGSRLSGCGRCIRATDPCLILVIQAPEADYLDAAVVSVLQIHV